MKTIPFTAAHTYIAHIWQCPPPLGRRGGWPIKVIPKITEIIVAKIKIFGHDGWILTKAYT